MFSVSRMFRSQNGGNSWEPQSRGLPENCYESILRGALSLDSRDPCGVYFGTTSGTVFGSDDGGESWSELVRSLPKILCVAAFEV